MRRQQDAEAILARRSLPAIRFFAWQFRRQLQGNFNAVRLSKSGPPPGIGPFPAVFYSNHPSWWDAVTYVHLGRTFFSDRAGYGPVADAQLKRYPMLDRLGIFGVDLDTFQGASQFLSVARALFAKPDTMLWVTAEGRFTDPRARPLVLRPGISHLAAGGGEVAFVPLAIEYCFWNEKRPELLVRFGEVTHASGWHGRRPALQARLEATLTTTLDALQEESSRRDAAAFQTLLDGKGGIGVVYDVMRRARFARKRERYDSRHRA